jgi:hypothetical protein
LKSGPKNTISGKSFAESALDSRVQGVTIIPLLST